MKYLSDAVYKRAEKDAEELLDQLKDSIEKGSNGLLRVNNWHWSGSWDVWSEIYGGMKERKKNVGWVGLYIGSGDEGFRLIGSMNPRLGGLDGRKKFALACKNKIEQIHLTRDYQKRYPGWNDCVIWFERKLTLGASREELGADLRKQANRFFKVAAPLLKGK